MEHYRSCNNTTDRYCCRTWQHLIQMPAGGDIRSGFKEKMFEYKMFDLASDHSCCQSNIMTVITLQLL